MFSGAWDCNGLKDVHENYLDLFSVILAAL